MNAKITALFTRMPRALRYLFSGGVGFLVDASGMECLVQLGVSVYLARIFSMAVAMMTTYILHRRITFGRDIAGTANVGQFSGYFACQMFTAAINYIVFICVLRVVPMNESAVVIAGITEGTLLRLFAICCGTGVGLVLNYTLLSNLVFAGEKSFWHYIAMQVRHNRRLGLWAMVVAGAAVAALLHQHQVLAWPDLAAPLGPADSDSWLRLMKVERWVEGANFFDNRIPMTNAPAGHISTSWSHAVDFLLFFLFRLMPQDLTVHHRLMLAATWMPMGLLVGMLGTAAFAARKIFDNIHVVFCALLLALGSSLTLNYFAPGDATQNGLLILLWCGVTGLLIDRQSKISALAAGVLAGLMVWTSVESVSIVIIAYLALAFSAIRDPLQMQRLVIVTFAAAVVMALTTMLEVPRQYYMTHFSYDSASMLQVFFLLLTAIVTGLLSIPFAYAGRKIRATMLLGGGIVIYCFVNTLYPQFFDGPYPNGLNSVIIGAEYTDLMYKGLWPQRLLSFLAPLLALVFLGGYLWQLRQNKKLHKKPDSPHHHRIFLLAGIFLLTLGAVFTDTVRLMYLQAVSVILASALIPAVVTASGNFSALRRLPRCTRPAFFTGGLLIIVAVLSMVTRNADPRLDGYMQCAENMRYTIQSGDLQAVLGARKQTIYTKTTMAGDLAFFTPYRYIAGNYYREAEGLDDWKRIALAKNEDEARKLLTIREVGSVFICPSHFPPGTWLHNLPDKKPQWLIPQTLRDKNMTGERPLLFRVAH